MHVFLPDDILELCFMRLPLTSLMNTRLVCKKWRSLTTPPRFMQMRREGYTRVHGCSFSVLLQMVLTLARYMLLTFLSTNGIKLRQKFLRIGSCSQLPQSMITFSLSEVVRAPEEWTERHTEECWFLAL